MKSPEEQEMQAALMYEVQSKIYRMAASYYLKLNRGEEVSLLAEDVSLLQSFIEEYLNRTGIAKADLKRQLIDWADNFKEEQIRPYINQYIRHIFTWGV